MTEAGLYLHIPFCKRKCNYCDFFSCIKTEFLDQFVEQLCNEISLVANRFPVKIKTIYLGGGTPSLLSEKNLDDIFTSIHNSFSVDSDETTIEINPNSSQYLSVYKKFGINRVSIGVQSLSDELLKKIGRLHTAEIAIKSLEEAGKYFDNVSADLIMGLSADQDICGDAKKIAPYCSHISAYMLSVNKKTPIYKMIKNKEFFPATDDEVAEQYQRLTDTVRELGFYRYETSNFSKLGKEGLHNGNYWRMKPYLGVGPSAHSYINGFRYYNKNDLSAYLEGVHSGNNKEIIERKASRESDITETIMLALRTTQGLNIADFNEKFSTDFIKKYRNGLNAVKKYTAIKNERLYILPQYFSVQNSIILSILTE